MPIAAGQFCLLGYWLKAVFGHFPAAVLYPFFLTVPSGCPTAFKNISSGYGLKRGNFHLFSLKGHLLLHLLKVEEAF
jgi:hypothetical protein